MCGHAPPSPTYNFATTKLVLLPSILELGSKSLLPPKKLISRPEYSHEYFREYFSKVAASTSRMKYSLLVLVYISVLVFVTWVLCGLTLVKPHYYGHVQEPHYYGHVQYKIGQCP